MKPIRLSILVISLCVIFSIQGELPARSADINQEDPATGLITQELYEGVDIPDKDISSSSPDPDLEPGFPVQTWHDAGTYMGGPAVHTRIGNIDTDPEVEILVSGLSQGPLYAFNYDGTPVSDWPFVFYNRSHTTSLGNLSNQVPGLEVFTGQFVLQVPEAPSGPMIGLAGNGSFLAGWPKDSAKDIWGGAALADINSDNVDEIIIYEGDYQTHAYLANGAPLPGWPIESDDPSYTIVDLDGDGDFEIVTFINWTSEGADLVAYHHNGVPVDNFMIQFEPYGHPLFVAGDVDGDGDNEIILFSRTFDAPYFALYVVGSTGLMERIIPLDSLNGHQGQPSAALALADMDGDHIPEIIIGCASGILVFKGDGSELQGFPVQWDSPNAYWVKNNAPVVGDVDNDGLQDIVMTTTKAGSSQYGRVYVYNSKGQLNSHFPKDLEIGFGAVPAIGDIDLDGRNEIIITGSYWYGHPGFIDKVWVYDLGGINAGNVEWGQLGGSPQNWGLYPAPPIYAGTNLFVISSKIIGSEPGQVIGIGDRYGNLGVAMASSAIMTATLETGLIYLGDTSGITPTFISQSVVWNLPNLGFSIQRRFELAIQLPLESTYGDSYTVEFSISADQLEADPADNTTIVEIKIVKQIYLSLIHR